MLIPHVKLRDLAGCSAVAFLCVATAPALAQVTETAHMSRAFYSYCCTHGGYETGWTTNPIAVNDGVVSAAVSSNASLDGMTGLTAIGFRPRQGAGDRIIHANDYIENHVADVISARSDSVAAGTGVALRLTVEGILSGSETEPSRGGASLEVGIRGVNAILIRDTDASVGQRITRVVESSSVVAVGGSWSFSQLFHMTAGIEPFTTVPYSANWTGRSRLFIDVLTPGVQLSSASGHDYSTPVVPEPGTWAMLLLGLGAVMTSVRRATRQPALS